MSESDDYRRVETTIGLLLEHRSARPSLDDLAAHVELSPFHFQRLFQRWAGTTPKRFQQYLGAAAARAHLREASSVLDATYEAGLSSPGRLHDLLVTVTALSPGEVRTRGRGVRIRHATHESPLGPAHIAVSPRGIVSLSFGDPAGALETLHSDWPEAELVADTTATGAIIERVFAPWSQGDVPLPVLLRGTNLQLRVWEALLQIPEGSVVSYGSLAAALDKPRAARAVASAVAANRIGYLIPCHRVLRASGEIGGYRWGEARKQALLAREFSK